MVDLFSHFGASEHDFARDEYQQDLENVSKARALSTRPQTHDLRLHHAIDETREQFGLVRAKHVMAAGKTFKTNGKLDVTGPDNVLNLEVGELGVEAELLNDASIFARGKFGIVLGFRTRDDHLSAGKNQGSSLGLADTHDDRGETL